MKKALLAAAAAALLLVPGCAPRPEADTLRLIHPEFPVTLDPADRYVSWTLVRCGVGECLTAFDEAMTPQPCLAEEWSLSADRLTWSFPIRKNLYFSNGRPLTAESVRASLERTFTATIRARAFFDPDTIYTEGNTLFIRTKHPEPLLPGLLADPLFLIMDTEAPGIPRRDGPIATGPYAVESGSADLLTLAANPHYRAPVPFRRVTVASAPDPGAAAMALQAGEADILIGADAGQRPLFQDRSRYTISEIASLRTALARFNTAPGRILSDPAVRKALISACDRATWCTVLLKNTYLPGSPAVPPSMHCGFEALTEPNPYDPARAARLLDEAGWTDTDGDGIREKDGRPLSLTYITYTSRPDLPALGEALQADALRAGIEIRIETADYNLTMGRVDKGDFDILGETMLTSGGGDPAAYLARFTKGSAWQNAEYQTLSDALATEFDQDRRRALMTRMQQILLDESPLMVFGYPLSNIVTTTRIQGGAAHPSDLQWIHQGISLRNS